MIPLWYRPYAIACGNFFILKPSEKEPMTMSRGFELIDQLGLPPGVVSLVNGSNGTVYALLDHPTVRAIAFAGSAAVGGYAGSPVTADRHRSSRYGVSRTAVIV